MSDTPHLRALAHPTRLRILSLLTGAELSATDVARELGITHANASYHLRLLLRAGEIVPAGEERVRGGVTKRYRHPWRAEDRPRPAAEDSAGKDATAELVVKAASLELVRRYHHRSGSGLITDAELWVTPEVYDEVRELLTQASNLLHDQAQAPRTDGAQLVNLTLATFPMDPA